MQHARSAVIRIGRRPFRSSRIREGEHMKRFVDRASFMDAMVSALALIASAACAAEDAKCGEKGQPLPAAGLDGKNVQDPLDKKDLKAVAASLEKAAGFAPDPKWNEGDKGWAKIAKDGAAAAQGGRPRSRAEGVQDLPQGVAQQVQESSSAPRPCRSAARRGSVEPTDRARVSSSSAFAIAAALSARSASRQPEVLEDAQRGFGPVQRVHVQARRAVAQQVLGLPRRELDAELFLACRVALELCHALADPQRDVRAAEAARSARPARSR